MAEDENFARINRELVCKAQAVNLPLPAVLDASSTEIPVYGEHEGSVAEAARWVSDGVGP
jgi:hypothetical protein